MLAAIDSAENTIHLETYIFDDDEVGRKFAAALIDKCNAGVAVRVIYDSLGSRESDDKFFEDMAAAGLEMLAYNVVNPINGGNPLNANNRTHRKILVVDSRVAFTGGINISQTYSIASATAGRGDPVKSGWRDTHISIEGPAVAAFEQLFAEHWQQAGAKLTVTAPRDLPACEASEDIVAVLQADGGNDEESAIFHSYFAAMKLAEERIWITQGYFAPDKRFTDLVVSAAKRGVDVRILVPGFSDTNAVVHASRSRYGRLLRKGVRIFEATNSVLHAKTAVIDGIWSTVGSSNLDSRSFLHNDEVNAVVLGAEFAAQMEDQFLADIDQARRIDYQQWRKRPIKDRFLEFLSWTVEYWL
jgi:cardiolipin synthase